MSLLTVENLMVHFPLGGGKVVRAVDGVSFTVQRGETLGVVGESGCGKSTTGRAILRLLRPTAGRVVFDGQEVLALSEAEMRRLRQRMQIVFQDPYASLSPRLPVRAIIREPLEIHRIGSNTADRDTIVGDLLNKVGLPQTAASQLPHEFSGGQRQRIGIARALTLNPDLIVLDEPVSALDISVRAQVVNLLMDLQQERGLAYIFIGHDLSLIRHVAHRVAVMYLGRIVEMATATQLYSNPRHPYTRSLFDAAPIPDPSRRRAQAPLEGDPPSPIDVPSGCRFRTRCPHAEPVCTEKDPELLPLGDGHGHASACHFALELPVWQPAHTQS